MRLCVAVLSSSSLRRSAMRPSCPATWQLVACSMPPPGTRSTQSRVWGAARAALNLGLACSPSPALAARRLTAGTAAIGHPVHCREVQRLALVHDLLVQLQHALCHRRRHAALPRGRQRQAQVLYHQLGCKAASVAAAGRHSLYDALCVTCRDMASPLRTEAKARRSMV